jgi:hypothetical protein
MYLEHQNLCQTLEPNFLLSKMNKCMKNRTNWPKLMRQVAEQFPEDEDHIYGMLLLSEVFRVFRMKPEQAIYFERAVGLSRKRNEKDEIVEFLHRKKMAVKKEEIFE